MGVLSGAFLIWVSSWMGKEFDERSISGEKCGEQTAVEMAQMGKQQNTVSDTSCVIEEKKESEEKNVV